MKTVLVVAQPDKILRQGREITEIHVGGIRYIFQLEGNREKIQGYVPDEFVVLGKLTGQFAEEVRVRTTVKPSKRIDI